MISLSSKFNLINVTYRVGFHNKHKCLNCVYFEKVVVKSTKFQQNWVICYGKININSWNGSQNKYLYIDRWCSNFKVQQTLPHTIQCSYLIRHKIKTSKCWPTSNWEICVWMTYKYMHLIISFQFINYLV